MPEFSKSLDEIANLENQMSEDDVNGFINAIQNLNNFGGGRTGSGSTVDGTDVMV